MKLKTSLNVKFISLLNQLPRLLTLLVCMLLGVYASAQSAPGWNSIGPAGGGLTVLLADPLAPRASLYAGTEVNGVFRSTDGGATWSAANGGMQTGRHVYAMAALGNFVYAATDGGVYVSSAGVTPAWTLAPRPANLGIASVVKYLASTSSTLYMSAADEPTIYAHGAADVSPFWNSTALPVGQVVSALGILAGDIAVGSESGGVFLADRSTGSLGWRDSEEGLTNETLPSRVLAGSLAALTTSSSKWAFACAGGQVFQADLSLSVPLTWIPLQPAMSGSCSGLAVARIGASQQSVLAVATFSGAYVSTVFDDSTASVPGLVPGPAFAMTSYVHAALQMDPAGLSNLFWATEFGLYSSSVVDLGNSVNLINSTPIAFNGPAKLSSPSQRLDNVNVQDVAVVGTSLYAIAQSGGNIADGYRDVMVSTDGGARWTPTGLGPLLTVPGAIGSLVVDTSRNVLYAATKEGVYYLQQGANSWLALTPDISYDVKAIAVGAQALYTGRKASASPNGAMVIQSLVGGPVFTTIESVLSKDFDVRDLLVSGGLVYAAGGALDSATGLYANSVYVAADYVAATAPAAPSWRPFGNNIAFASPMVLTHLAVGAGQVFAGGDGFLRRCASDSGCGWGAVLGLPLTTANEFENISALATDSTTLYVGTAQGLLSVNLADIALKSLLPINGTGSSALPSLVVNGLRVMGGSIYVATSAGLASQSANVTVPVTAGGSGGGGCSMAMVNEPDPLLWLLVVTAMMQLIYARKRRSRQTALIVADLHGRPEARS